VTPNPSGIQEHAQVTTSTLSWCTNAGFGERAVFPTALFGTPSVSIASTVQDTTSRKEPKLAERRLPRRRAELCQSGFAQLQFRLHFCRIAGVEAGGSHREGMIDAAPSLHALEIPNASLCPTGFLCRRVSARLVGLAQFKVAQARIGVPRQVRNTAAPRPKHLARFLWLIKSTSHPKLPRGMLPDRRLSLASRFIPRLRYAVSMQESQLAGVRSGNN